MSSNSWLRQQRKSDLVDIADSVKLKNYESLKKTELEVALDEYLSANASRFSSNPELASYYKKAQATSSPVKKEIAKSALKDEVEKDVKVVKRRSAKVADDVADGLDRASSSALIQTPRQSLSQVAARIPLPATPADIANSTNRATLAMRKRVSSIYRDSGITDVTEATRAQLSTVHAIVALIAVVELYFVRPEVLADRFAFTIPAISVLGTPDYPVYLPDMFLLVTWSFWSPALTWLLTSFIVPTVAGYFFNLGSHTTGGAPRTRSRAASNEYAVDPLIFSIAKALIGFVVYGQGVTFGGLLNDRSIERLDSALYGGYKGVLTGAAISGLASLYDAVLKR